jgi:nucleotide-binding universal stress UspA family protein
MSAEVVVGVDGSAGSVAAARWAGWWARRTGSSVSVVCADEPLLTGLGDPDGGLLSGTSGLDTARGVVHLAGIDDVVGSTEILTGSSPAVLVDRSETADLLVVGHRDRLPLLDLFTGSVGARVADRAGVPVVIIPQTWEAPSSPGPTRFVVGIDGSESSSAALDWTIGQALEDDLVAALHCWQEAAFAGPTPTELGHDEHQSATDLLEELVEGCLRTDERPVQKWVRSCDPRRGLIDAGEHADVLVLGQRGHRGLARVLFGSISAHIAHRVTEPTVFVPHS